MNIEKGLEKNNQPRLLTGTGKSTLVSNIIILCPRFGKPPRELHIFDTLVDFPVSVQSTGGFY